MGLVIIIKKKWSLQELDKLIRLSVECPPVVIAKELSRPVTSVRKKMREIGVPYVTGEQWKKRQIQSLIFNERGIRKNNSIRSAKETAFESQVLDEFWLTLVKMARVAKMKGRRIDVHYFINTYRQIR